MTPLHARSRWLDGSDIDLVSVAGSDGWLWERDHVGFAGRGCALEISLPHGLGAPGGAPATVTAALAAIDVDDEVGAPGSGPVAVGAIPFDRAAPATLTVPAVVVGRTASGRCWQTTIGVDDPGRVVIDGAGVSEDPDGFVLTSPIPHETWMGLVAEAVADIDAGRLAKVVLAREVHVETNRPVPVPTVLRRLRALYPACTLLSAPTPNGARFIAASPELLVSRIGREVHSHPLAGTIPRSGDPSVDQARADELLASAKDRAEHDWVVRDVERALQPWCVALDVPEGPSIVSFRNVSHLGTEIAGKLREDEPPSALALAAALHPTAAVGGTPREAALAWLRANERLDRGPYAGPVGWVDATGDGEWVVGIRSAVIDGTGARLFAGVGVVEGSDPASELAETQFKLQALLAAVVRP